MSVSALNEFVVLELFGPAAVQFLQGQVSADVEALHQGASAEAFLLEPNGKTVSLMRLYRESDDRIWMIVDANALDATVARLRKFMIRTKATLETRNDLFVLHLESTNRSELPHQVKVIATGPPLMNLYPGEMFIVSDVASEAVSELQSGSELALQEWYRIASCYPKFGTELDLDSVPASFPDLIDRAVSFTKGCYVGQELVERMDSRDSSAPFAFRAAKISLDDPSSQLSRSLVGAQIQLSGELAGVVTSFSSASLDSTDAAFPVAILKLKRKFDKRPVYDVRIGDLQVGSCTFIGSQR